MVIPGLQNKPPSLFCKIESQLNYAILQNKIYSLFPSQPEAFTNTDNIFLSIETEGDWTEEGG